MTFEEVTALGAQFVRFAWTKCPTNGWKEVSIEEIRRMVATSAEHVRNAPNAKAHQDAQAFHTGATVSLERAEAGARVFWVPMHGTAIFAATKPGPAKTPKPD
jgi:hypothetical protein